MDKFLKPKEPKPNFQNNQMDTKL